MNQGGTGTGAVACEQEIFDKFRPALQALANQQPLDAATGRDLRALLQAAGIGDSEASEDELRDKALLTWRSHRARRGDLHSWPFFDAFLGEVGLPPTMSARLVTRGYGRKAGPGNARWDLPAHEKDQLCGREYRGASAAALEFADARARQVSYAGETLSIAEWSRRTGIKYGTLVRRLSRGVPLAKALAPERCNAAEANVHGASARPHSQLEFEGKTLTLAEWAEAKNVPLPTLIGRLRRGWSVTETLTGMRPGVRRGRPPKQPGQDPGGSAAGRSASHKTGSGQGRAKLVTHDGLTLSIADWARKSGVSYATVCQRLARGLPMQEVLSPERRRPGRTRTGTASGAGRTRAATNEAISKPRVVLRRRGAESQPTANSAE